MMAATVDQVVVGSYNVVAGAGTAVTTAVILLFEKDLIRLKFARLVKCNTHFLDIFVCKHFVPNTTI